VAAKTSGRIREITVREGDCVEAGQVIATLDDQQIRACEQQAEAAVRQAQHQNTVLGEQLKQNEFGVDGPVSKIGHVRGPRVNARL
jgi:HlyD family secretion protein